MNNELKPCPFCGNESITAWPMDNYLSPCCESCGATIEANISGDTTKEQFKAWNTRAADKCRDTAIEAILSLPARNLTRQQAIQSINKAFGEKELANNETKKGHTGG